MRNQMRRQALDIFVNRIASHPDLQFGEDLETFLLTDEEILLDFGKAVKLLGACEGKPLSKSFTDLGTKSEVLPVKLEKEITGNHGRQSQCFQAPMNWLEQ